MQCAGSFSYISNGIRPRKYCGDFCRTLARNKSNELKPLCVVEGCFNKRHYSSGICNACYCRQKATGSTEKRVWAYRSLSSHGYVKVSKSDHPLSNQGIVYEHRKVLYDAIGVGPHPCHWCAEPVNWYIGKAGTIKDGLVVDHLDGDKQNNAVGNLVPACNLCNAARGGFQKWVMDHADDPWLWPMYQAFVEDRERKCA